MIDSLTDKIKFLGVASGKADEMQAALILLEELRAELLEANKYKDRYNFIVGQHLVQQELDVILGAETEFLGEYASLIDARIAK